MNEKIKEALVKQMELLAERSQKAETRELCDLTDAMCEVAKCLAGSVF